jgi:hypothetical protein
MFDLVTELIVYRRLTSNTVNELSKDSRFFLEETAKPVLTANFSWQNVPYLYQYLISLERSNINMTVSHAYSYYGAMIKDLSTITPENLREINNNKRLFLKLAKIQDGKI